MCLLVVRNRGKIFDFRGYLAARAASRVNQALAPMGKIQTSINLRAKITTFGFKAAAAIVTNVIDALSVPLYTRSFT